MPSRRPTIRSAASRFGAGILDAAAITIVAASLALAVANLVAGAGDARLFVVSGASMAPVIPRGALIAVTPLPSDGPVVGDVVTVAGESGVKVTHRVTRRVDLNGQLFLELRGDANAEPDPVLVPRSAVVGRVSAAIPVAGYGQMLLARPAGWLLLLGTVLTLSFAASLLRLPRQPARELAHRPLVSP